MPRHVRLVHDEDVLDAATKLPAGGRQPEGEVRGRVAHSGDERGEREQPRAVAPQAQPLQVAFVTPQPGAQAARLHGLGVHGALAAVLREELQARHSGHQRPRLQRDLDGGGRVRPDVLQPRLQDPGDDRGRAVRLHLPVVLRGQVQRLPQQEKCAHLPVSLSPSRPRPPKLNSSQNATHSRMR